MATLQDILNDKILNGGYSKTYVAEQLNVGEKTIENYMNGTRKPSIEKIVKLSTILGFHMNDLSEQSVPNISKQKPIKLPSEKDNYVALLESNDRFFKNEYAQLLLSLKELIGLSKKQEALLKLNLQHVGTVEALQRGVNPEIVQEQINTQIADMVPSEEMDNDADT